MSSSEIINQIDKERLEVQQKSHSLGLVGTYLGSLPVLPTSGAKGQELPRGNVDQISPITTPTSR